MCAKLKELIRRLKLQVSIFSRQIVKPFLPKNNDGKLLLHIGCGETNSSGFINDEARLLARIQIPDDSFIRRLILWRNLSNESL